MGGKATTSNSKSSTTTQNLLGNSTTSNPFVISSTNNNGTNSSFAQNSALGSINDFVNDNVQSMLHNYLNPSIQDPTSQAKLNIFSENLNKDANKFLENNIINPLSQRNMIRSSQATDLYNNMQNSINDSIANYTNELLASSQENNAQILNNMMDLYLKGYDVISDNQAQSLNTSAQNATKKTDSKLSNTSFGAEIDLSDWIKV